MGSTSRSVDEPPPCGSVVLSPSKSGCAQRGFMMMPPEEKLKHFDSRAQAHEDNREFDACIQDLVRCVALTRLVYGEGHLKLAQAHVRLAKAYFQFKVLEIEETSVQHYVRKYCVSTQLPSCIWSLVFDSQTIKSGTHIMKIVLKRKGKPPATFTVNKSYQQLRVFKRQNRLEEALNQCERSLQLLEGRDQPDKTCSVYRDMAAIEHDKGHSDRALEHLSKARAHAIAMSHSPGELEAAQISHSLALILSAAEEPHHNDELPICRYTFAEMRGDPESLSPSEEIYIW
ncbi:hypothetical protein F2P81_007045 [Scophthalmus maximus]|uniref:Uncharacterized protein n=1 Tax=Scophthalmus maximus TaxID=52904 RepID=A0A6A4T4M5_SCOMX|nr:hypothetical protein F2P81_007045 [Scophthalmus maximus]